eukprot:CAMPEP_0177653918 /NCGR_PEP_ID=MMETSP0447-20121125/14009_1 /TAXON_ID=0 /ORGANISM="Stygamoeba regulata, Strain BSH-02190019" /LENGTH=548 /DNA_ID=CAMNT_0019157441 /DNA_START=45 /DNA_END=1687 /DNA_ORIENTATION=+
MDGGVEAAPLSLTDLPPELLGMVLAKLPYRTQLQCRRVCRAFAQAVDMGPPVWHWAAREQFWLLRSAGLDPRMTSQIDNVVSYVCRTVDYCVMADLLEFLCEVNSLEFAKRVLRRYSFTCSSGARALRACCRSGHAELLRHLCEEALFFPGKTCPTQHAPPWLPRANPSPADVAPGVQQSHRLSLGKTHISLDQRVRGSTGPPPPTNRQRTLTEAAPAKRSPGSWRRASPSLSATGIDFGSDSEDVKDGEERPARLLSVKEARSERNYALKWAARNGHVETVRYLFDHFGLTRNDVATDNHNPLRSAVLGGSLEVVQLLCERCSLHTDDTRACLATALPICAARGHFPMVHFLVEHFQLQDHDLLTSLQRSHNSMRCHVLLVGAEHGHFELVKYLCSQLGLSADIARSCDNFALRWSAQNGHCRVVRFLVQHFNLSKADALAENSYALRWSARNGHLHVVRFLCTHFDLTVDDVRACNNYALAMSAADGRLSVVKYLVRTYALTKADVLARDCYGLVQCCLRRQTQLARSLGAQQADGGVLARSAPAV